MFGSHAQLPADMPCAELLQEGFVLVRHQVVETKSGADEYLPDSGKRPELLQKLQIVRMIHLKIGAGLRKQASSMTAGAPLKLRFARRSAEFCRGPSYVIDIPLEVRLRDKLFCLLQDRFMASSLHDPSFMEGQRAEVAVPEAPPVAGQAELDVPQRRDAAVFVIYRVPGPHIGKSVDIIHFHLRQRHGRRILHNEQAVVIGLIQPLCLERIGILMLDREAAGVSSLISSDLFK